MLPGISSRHDGSTDAPCQACGKNHLIVGPNLTQTMRALGFTDAEIRAIIQEGAEHYQAPTTSPSDLEAQRARVRERVRRHRSKKRGLLPV